MSDLQVPFLVLGAFYAWECACWLPHGSVAFTTWLGRVWRPRFPATLLGNWHGGLVIAPPIPPLGTLLQCSPFPFSLSPEGALAHVPTFAPAACRPAQPAWFVSWEQFRDARAAGRKLLVNGRLWWTAPSSGLAAQRAAELQRLAGLSESNRAAALREMVQAALDTAEVKRRIEAFGRLAGPLRPWCNALVLFTFVVSPAATWFVGLGLSWPALLTALLAQIAVVAILFARAHRALFPGATDDRFARLMTVALSPANAMRAMDAVSRPLLEPFHPLAVAAVLLPAPDFARLARAVLLDLRHPCRPVCPSADSRAAATELYARRLLLRAAERLVGQMGLSADALCQPPQPAEPECRAYCPRCCAQFTSSHGACPDCGGIELVAFEQPAHRQSSV